MFSIWHHMGAIALYYAFIMVYGVFILLFILMHCETCLQRTPQYHSVPTCQVSLHDRCPYMPGVPTCQVSLHERCPYMTGVPTWKVSLHERCPYMTGVPTWQVSHHQRCLSRRELYYHFENTSLDLMVSSDLSVPWRQDLPHYWL